jgi:hypothetical protein
MVSYGGGNHHRPPTDHICMKQRRSHRRNGCTPGLPDREDAGGEVSDEILSRIVLQVCDKGRRPKPTEQSTLIGSWGPATLEQRAANREIQPGGRGSSPLDRWQVAIRAISGLPTRREASKSFGAPTAGGGGCALQAGHRLARPSDHS